MTMDERVARINALARKAKTEGLTPAETEERDRLRKEYLAAVRRNLTDQLDHTYLVYPDGTKRRLREEN